MTSAQLCPHRLCLGALCGQLRRVPGDWLPRRTSLLPNTPPGLPPGALTKQSARLIPRYSLCPRARCFLLPVNIFITIITVILI